MRDSQVSCLHHRSLMEQNIQDPPRLSGEKMIKKFLSPGSIWYFLFNTSSDEGNLYSATWIEMYLLGDTRTTARWKLVWGQFLLCSHPLGSRKLAPLKCVWKSLTHIFTIKEIQKIVLNHNKEQSRGYSWRKEKGRTYKARSTTFHLPVSCTLEISSQRLHQEDTQNLLWTSWGPAEVLPQGASLLVHSLALCKINSSRLMMSCHSAGDEHSNNLTLNYLTKQNSEIDPITRRLLSSWLV